MLDHGTIGPLFHGLTFCLTGRGSAHSRSRISSLLDGLELGDSDSSLLVQGFKDRPHCSHVCNRIDWTEDRVACGTDADGSMWELG